MPNRPQTGCSIIIERGGEVLLAKRSKEPFKGCWSLPGGSQETGETLEECAMRELLEETGLTADSLRFVRARDRIVENVDGKVVYHFVIHTFIAESVEGEAKALSDTADVGWFTRNDMREIEMTPGTAELLIDVLGVALA